MDDTLFETLELRVDSLIKRCRQLEKINQELEANRNALLAERVNYLSQKKQVVDQLEHLITKLEAAEDMPTSPNNQTSQETAEETELFDNQELFEEE